MAAPVMKMELDGLAGHLEPDGRQEPVVGLDGLVARVHQVEGTGAVGVLRVAFVEAGLPEQGGLLVTERPGDGDLLAEEAVGVGVAVVVLVGGGPYLGNHLLRHAELV